MGGALGARLKRTWWRIRRFRAKRIVGFILVMTAALAAGNAFGRWPAAILGAVAGLVLAGAMLAKPLKGIGRMVFVRPPPWRDTDESMWFAGADLGFTPRGYAGDAAPRSVVERMTTSGRRFMAGQVSLELWLVATDEAGSPWTVVQERLPTQAADRVWTSSADSALEIADLDESGRPDPYRAAIRIAKEELDVPVARVQLVGWGRETTLGGTRDVVVGLAYTPVAAESLSGLSYPGDRGERAAHLIPLTVEGVAKGLGWGHPGQWNGGAAFGLLETVEHVAPGSWVGVERAVAPRWYEKAMFARLERGTQSVSAGAKPSDSESVASA